MSKSFSLIVVDHGTRDIDACRLFGEIIDSCTEWKPRYVSLNEDFAVLAHRTPASYVVNNLFDTKRRHLANKLASTGTHVFILPTEGIAVGSNQVNTFAHSGLQLHPDITYLGWNHESVRAFQRAHPGSRAVLLGSLRHELLRHYVGSPRTKKPEQFTNILVCTNFVHANSKLREVEPPVRKFEQLAATTFMEAALNLAQQVGGVVRYRHHPYEREYNRLISRSLADELVWADLVLCRDSTLLVDAASTGTPVINYTFDYPENHFFHGAKVFSQFPTVLLGQGSDFRQSLRALAEIPQDWVKLADDLVNVGIDGGKPSDKLKSLLSGPHHHPLEKRRTFTRRNFTTGLVYFGGHPVFRALKLGQSAMQGGFMFQKSKVFRLKDMRSAAKRIEKTRVLKYSP